MDISAISGNILNPPVMFFFLGMACMTMAFLVPIFAFFLFRYKIDVHNSAALAASFGSISAVTFVTAGAFLHNIGQSYQGFIVAGMALMESPAIVVGVILDRVLGRRDKSKITNWKKIFHEDLFGSSIYILIGALLVGYVSGQKGWESTKPFSEDIFKGFLIFFLLDKGIAAAERFKELKSVGFFLIACSLLLVLVNATIGIFLTKMIGMNAADSLMFTILCASASYIAVAAAMKDSIPEANPGKYLTVALSIVFPFNVILGIPLYYYIINTLAT